MSTNSTLMLDRPGDGPAYAPRVMWGRVAWLPWVNPGPIATARHERTFIAELAGRAGAPTPEFTRSDLTAVLNALRGGLTVDALLSNAPGLQLGRLYGAYEEIEDRRRRATIAWDAIVADPTPESLEEHGEQAARLVPVLVQRLLETADIDAALLPRVTASLVAGIGDVRRLIHQSEAELDRRVDDATAMAISRTLYDPTSDCVFSRVEHLPERVGSLVPTRVAALLNEHVQGLSFLAAS